MYQPLFFYLTTILLSLPLIIATAASQFHLDPLVQVSDCFYTCHTDIVQNIQLETRQDGAFYITDSCRHPQWQGLVPPCLAQTCISAPDAAYGLEYAKSFCIRAGVDISNMTLPETYVQQASGYFQSEAYLSGAGRTLSVLGLGGLGAVVAVTVAGLL